jgi:hypothetical protein
VSASTALLMTVGLPLAVVVGIRPGAQGVRPVLWRRIVAGELLAPGRRRRLPAAAAAIGLHVFAGVLRLSARMLAAADRAAVRGATELADVALDDVAMSMPFKIRRFRLFPPRRKRPWHV